MPIEMGLPASPTSADGAAEPAWVGRGKVRARASEGGLEIRIEGVTTQAKYYKPLVYEFFRKEYRLRPRHGDFAVRIVMEHVGEPPRLDLDNLAKALLDALTGHVFYDDCQVALLVVERCAAARETITVLARMREAMPPGASFAQLSPV